MARNKKQNLRQSLPRFGVAALLLALAGGLMLLFGQAGPAFFPGYRAFSKGVIGALATLCSVTPFALWDILLVPIALAAIGSIVWCVVRKRSLWKWLSTTCIIIAALVLFMVGAWGLNHYAPPLSDELGLEVSTYSADELEDATAYFLAQAAAHAQSVPREADKTLTRQDFSELARIAGASYADLAQKYPLFEGSSSPVKELLLMGEPLLYSGHTGIFWPFTGEANVPRNEAIASMPFTMCHEAAHRLGIASEQEANFAAFLACTGNNDERFVYAGYREAFGYCLNALAANYPERAQKFLQEAIGDEVDPHDAKTYGARLVLFDRYNTIEYYRQYEGPVEDVGIAANDAYLKTFSEESGVKSYGEVVDYLIAWHLQ